MRKRDRPEKSPEHDKSKNNKTPISEISQTTLEKMFAPKPTSTAVHPANLQTSSFFFTANQDTKMASSLPEQMIHLFFHFNTPFKRNNLPHRR